MITSELSPVQFEIPRVLEWDDWKKVAVPNIAAAAKLKIPHLRQLKPHDGHAVIVGAGPSAIEFLKFAANGGTSPLTTLFSLNGAHNWLLERKFKPSIHVLFEHDVDLTDIAIGGPLDLHVAYYVASHCCPEIFRELKAYRSVLWHAAIPLEQYQAAIAEYFPGEFMVGGGFATFFKTLTIAYILGFRKFDLFGVDGSFETNSHLDGYRTSNVEESINIWGVNPKDDTVRKFRSHGGLAFQANEFITFCGSHHSDIKLKVHGDSLIRYLHETRYPEQYKS